MITGFESREITAYSETVNAFSFEIFSRLPNFLHLSSKINNSESKFYLDILDEENHHVHVHCYTPKPQRLYVVIVDICKENNVVKKSTSM